MNILTHLIVAVFTGLLAPNTAIGIWIVIAQLLPLADLGLKYIFQYEPLHTLVGTFVLGFLYWANLPFIYGYLLVSHTLHLILDMLVPEGITLFEPFSQKHITFQMQGSERIVATMAVLGILFLSVYKLLL